MADAIASSKRPCGPGGSSRNSASGIAAARAAAASTGATSSPRRPRTSVGVRTVCSTGRTSIFATAVPQHQRHHRARRGALHSAVHLAETGHVGDRTEEGMGQCAFAPMVFDLLLKSSCPLGTDTPGIIGRLRGKPRQRSVQNQRASPFRIRCRERECSSVRPRTHRRALGNPPRLHPSPRAGRPCAHRAAEHV